MENSNSFRFKKLPYDPAIPLLGIHPEKTIIQKDTCTPISTAVLFTIDRTWKQPKCPSTEEQTQKMRCTHTRTRKYYSATKRHDTAQSADRRMDTETVIQRKGVRQKEKNTV